MDTRRYEMTTIDAGTGSGLTPVDKLLIAAGSDVRGHRIATAYATNKVDAGSLLVFEFDERTEQLSSAEETEDYRGYEQLGMPVRVVRGGIADPPSCLKELEKPENVLSREDRVALDITLFTKPYFFWILKYLSVYVGISNVSAYYTEPESYRYSAGTFDSYQSTYGPLHVREMPGYPGEGRAVGSRLLVVLLGFDGQLSTAINDDVAPNKTIVVNGFPSYCPKFKDISLVNNERLVAGARSVMYAPAHNPFETYNLLQHIRDKREDAVMTIAPLGTKPMALGACLFAISNEDVRVVYPLPETYAKKTTRASWRSWRYDMDVSAVTAGG